jgi:hypothetical protein
MSLVVDDYVVGLQVSVDDVTTMEILDCEHHLCDVELGFILGEMFPSVAEHGLEVTTWAKVHDQEEFLLCLKCVMQLYNEWAAAQCEHISLCFGIP